MPLDFLHIAVCMHVRLNACVMVDCICLKVTVNNTVTCYKHTHAPHLDTRCKRELLWFTAVNMASTLQSYKLGTLLMLMC